MKLLLIRHAIAEDKEVFARTGQPDDLRPLTDEGVRKMQQVARGLVQIVTRINVIASSPLLRARQTADVVEEQFQSAHREVTKCICPDARPEELIEWLETHRRKGCVAAVGHEPHLSGLASWLMTGSVRPLLEMKKGSALMLEFDHGVAAGKGKLRWFLSPAHLGGLRSI